MRDNPLKARLARGETVFGTMVFEFDSPGLARIVKAAGADYIILDMEHSGWSFETVKDQIQFARGAGLVPLVNPPGDDFNLITRSLDLGAKGLLVPVVETKAQAEAIVRATRYPPHGNRGSAFGVAHDDYVIGDAKKTMKAANAGVLVMVKIETRKGVANVDEIMAVPGVDVAFVGHTDLSVSLGMPLEFERPEFVRARDAVLAACKRHGKIAGNLVGNPKWGKAWIRKGFRMIAYMGDIWLLESALRSGIDAMRSAAPKPKRRR
ncbi:MAG: aldolase [Alphaproteobacteria bacterium]|nr:aldolase [Alphaproteobacteria bacterium]